MRVLVTRPAPDAARTAAALERAGHAAVVAPVSIVRRTGPPPPAGRFDALAATSAHAFAAEGQASPPGDGLDRALPVYAVGSRTAAAARAAGFRDVRVGTGDAASLASLLSLTLPRGARLLYLAGRDRKPDLEAALAAASHAFTVAEVYAAEPADSWPAEAREALASGRVDAALHYSRRSAALALDLARREGVEDALLLLRHLCLSADAAEPLIERRAARVAVAARPEEASLLALVAAEP